MSTLSVNNVTEVGGAPVVTGGVLDSGSLPTGTVLQVVSTTKTDTFSTNSTTPTDVTGLSVSITPTSATSKIYVFATLYAGNGAGYSLANLSRDGSPLVVGTGGSAWNRTGIIYPGTGVEFSIIPMPMQYLDSPASTSTLTYNVKINAESSSTYMWVNRRNANNSFGCTSSITVMEVAG